MKEKESQNLAEYISGIYNYSTESYYELNTKLCELFVNIIAH